MGNELKNYVKQMFNAYASPVPYMVRDGWEAVADYGASRPTLENVARGYYGRGLNNLMDRVNMINNPNLYNLLNEANNRNNYYMLQNEMKYNPDFLRGTY